MTTPLVVIFGAGPVGTTTAIQLAESGARVRVVTRSGTGPTQAGIERHRADLLDLAEARTAAAGATAVVMAVNPPYRTAAWADAFPRFQANAIAVAAANDAVLVTAENLYMYAPSTRPVTPDLPMQPVSKKGAVRAQMAETLFAAHDRGEVRASSIRSADFLGPHVLESTAGERFVPKLLSGKRAQVIGAVDVPHAFTYLPDLARTIVAAIDQPVAWGRAWHSPVITVSVRALAEAVHREAATAGTARLAAVAPWMLKVLPVPFLRELGELRYQFDRPFLVDASATERELGVGATPLDIAVRETVGWWRSRVTAAPVAAA